MTKNYRRANRTWSFDVEGNRLNDVAHESINAAKRFVRASKQEYIVLEHKRTAANVPSKQVARHGLCKLGYHAMTF